MNLSDFVQSQVLVVPDHKIKELFQENTNKSILSAQIVSIEENITINKLLESKVVSLSQEFN